MKKIKSIKKGMESFLTDLEQKSIEAEKNGTGVRMPERFKKSVNKSLGKEVFKIDNTIKTK